MAMAKKINGNLGGTPPLKSIICVIFYIFPVKIVFFLSAMQLLVLLFYVRCSLARYFDQSWIANIAIAYERECFRLFIATAVIRSQARAFTTESQLLR